MLSRLLCVLGLAALVAIAVPAQGAVIITTTGERIVCKIVQETATYFVIDHEGYRRYLLKSQVRSLDRAATGDDGVRRARQSLEVLGGYQVYGNRQERGLSGLRLAYGRPLGRYMVLEGNLHVGRSTVASKHEQDGLFSGPLQWTGATVGAAWEMRSQRVRPLVDVGVGYFLMRHSVTAAEVEFMRQNVIEIVLPDSTTEKLTDYSEPMGGGLGVTMGAGIRIGLSQRLGLVMRTSLLVISTEFQRRWYYEKADLTMNSPEGITLRMLQSHVGLELAF